MTIDQIKKLLGVHPAQRFTGVNTTTSVITADTGIQWGGALQYDFINLGNQPVIINGYFLDRYYAGTVVSPTVIAGSNNRFTPLMKAGEIDNTAYNVVFQSGFYGVATDAVVNKLLVVVKQWMPNKG